MARSVGDLLDTRLPAILILTIGIAGCLLALRFTNPYTVVLPPVIVAFGVIAFFHSPNSYRRLPQPLPFRIILIGYFLVVTSTVVLYRNAGYSRTLPIHVLTIVLYGIVILLLFSDASDRLTLGSLITVAILQRSMTYYAGAIQMGMDSVSHARAAGLVSKTGTRAPLSETKYWYAPWYHYLTAIGEQFLGTSIRLSALLLVGLMLAIVPPLLIYVLTTRYWDGRVGIIAALLFVTADYVVGWSVMPTPTTLGIVFFAISLYAMHNYVTTGDKWQFAVLGVGLGALMATHQVSLFITVIALSIYVVVSTVSTHRPHPRATVLASLLGSVLLLDWITTVYGGPGSDSPSFIGSVALQFLGRLQRAGARDTVRPVLENAAFTGADALTPMHTIGLGLLLGFGVLGGLTWLRHSDRAPLRVAVPLGIAVGVLFALTLAGPLVNLDLLIPRRWFAFIYVPVSIFAAVGIAAITSAPRRSVNPSVVIVLLLVCVLPIVIFMSFNFMGALDDPVFDAPESQRFAMSESEVAGYQAATEYQGDQTLVADFLAWTLIARYFGADSQMYLYDMNGEVMNEGDRLYIQRPYVATESNSYNIRFEGRTIRVYGPLPSQPSGGTVYDNGNVTLVSPDRGSD